MIRQLYTNCELIYKMSEIANFSILFKIIFMIALMSNLYIILYNSATKILLMIRLYFIKNQRMIFVLLAVLTKQIIYLICNNLFLLFANKKFVKIIS